MFGIVVISPFLIVLAVIISLDSKGPVFYRGVRCGRYGKPFKIFKFRTMVIDAENLGGGTTALEDPRITKIGGFIRKSKLDELPQLFNVLKGEMSFVGPRPELLQYTNQYTEEEKIILSVRPGITDLSSIEFSSLDTHVGSENADSNFEARILPKKNQLRVKYVKERGFFLDMYLIAKTILLVFRKMLKAVFA